MAKVKTSSLPKKKSAARKKSAGSGPKKKSELLKKTSPAAKKVATKSSKKTSKAKAPAKGKKKKRKPETLMCFLTTACVHYYNLPDNGYELNTLRQYRDTYLANSKGGKELISEYYRISPLLVQHIEKDKQKRSVYSYIHKTVLSACAHIEKKHLQPAKNIYTQMVQALMERYQVN